MNNVEALQKFMKEMVDNQDKFDSLDMIAGYLVGIAYSLAVITDKLTEKEGDEQEPRKGEWLRMSDLSEQEDDRYQCSRCKNVVHYKDKMNLYTFNSWCGRCGSDNGRKIGVEV